MRVIYKILFFLIAVLIISESYAGPTLTNQGNGSKNQLSTGSTTTNDCVKFDVNGNVVDAGAACSTGGTPGGTANQIQYNNAGAFGGFTMGGDCTIVVGTGIITCTKTNGSAFVASATTDTTNASNISSGTLNAARLPNPSSSTLGGVQSIAAVSHNFLTSISTIGVPSQAQPAFTDISGNATLVQLPSIAANTVLGALTATTPSALAVPSCSTATSALTWTSGTGFGCNSISGGVSSVSNSDSTLTISPTTGAVVASINLGHTNTWTKSQLVSPVTDSISGATFTPDFSASNNHNITLVHASCPCTLANPTNVVAGQSGQIVVNQSATGSDTINSYGTSYVFTNASPPTLSTAASATDVLSYYVIDSTHIRISALVSAPPVAFTTAGTGLSASSSTINSNAVYQIPFSPGVLTSVTNTTAMFGKIGKAATVDNMVGSAYLFSCVSNPTVTMYECGTSSTCASPTTIGTVTITATGQAFNGTVSNPAITAGDYVAWSITAGTCTSIDLSVTAQVHSN